MANQQPNVRRNYFINPGFQLKFSIFVSLIILLSSIVYPLVIYAVFDSFLTFVAEKNLSNEAPTVFNNWRNDLITLMVTYQVLFSIFIFLSCILISHRIAGPIHKARLIIREIASGRIPEHIKFRKKDNFQELAEDLDVLAQKLKSIPEFALGDHDSDTQEGA